jgi:5'-deoxynucleotidase
MLPEKLRKCHAPLVLEDDETVTPIVKAADKLSAYIKCIEEQKAGNTEFDSAAKQSMEAMLQMDMPELRWFIDQCLEPFSLNIDQL